MEKSNKVPQKLNMKLPYVQQYHFWIHILRNWKDQRDICTPKFIGALYTTMKMWMQPKCLSTKEWILKTWSFVPFVQWNIIQP